MELQSANGRSIRTIKLWLKAFVPNTDELARPVLGDGEHAGKTMLNHLWLTNRCFLTDQRSFSNDIHAEARMHSEIEIDLAKGKETYQFHHCYDTIEVDCRTGAEKCRAQGSTSRMNFHDFEVEREKQLYTVHIKAASKNPCIKIGALKITPNLDFTGVIHIAMTEDPSRAIVTFTGKVEEYPAFEMYACANNGTAETVFQVDVAPRGAISDLPGGPTREIFGRAELCTNVPLPADD